MTCVVVAIEGEVNAIVVEQVQTKVLMIEGIHASQWISKQHAKENAYGPTVHADKHVFFRGAGKNMIDRGLHSFNYVVGTFSTFYSQRRIPCLPLLQHVMVVGVFVRSYPITFLRAPAYFI